MLAKQRQSAWWPHLQEALEAAGEDNVAMVTLNNKASVTIHPPMFGRDDPLSRLRALPERFREFKLEPGILDFGWEIAVDFIPQVGDVPVQEAVLEAFVRGQRLPKVA